MTITDDGSNYFLGTNYFVQSTLAIAESEVESMLDTLLGDTRRADISATQGRYVIEYRPVPSAGETFTENNITALNNFGAIATSPSNFARFTHTPAFSSNSSTFFFAAIATNDDVNSASSTEKIQTIATNTNGYSYLADPQDLCWITANDRSLASFVRSEGSGAYLFVYTGVMLEMPSLFGDFPRNCVAIAVGEDASGNKIADAIRVPVENSNSIQQVLTAGDANYSFTCSDSQTAGTDLWAADLYMIDDDAGNNNPATGRCPNMLLAKGASFVIGQAYSLNTAHQDGGSNKFMCVGEWGADKILMRVNSSF